jgi:hypothetical protein
MNSTAAKLVHRDVYNKCNLFNKNEWHQQQSNKLPSSRMSSKGRTVDKKMLLLQVKPPALAA